MPKYSTGWFQHIVPNLLREHSMSTLIFGDIDRSWNLAYVFYKALPTRYRMCVCFRQIYILFWYFFWVLGSYEIKMSGKKTKQKKNPPPIRQRLGGDA